MKKFLSIAEHVENHFLTSGQPGRAMSREQHDAQAELRSAFKFNGNLGDFIVPFETRERRDMTATGTTATTGDQGGMTIANEVLEIGVALNSASVLPRLGARNFYGLRGNIDLPTGKGNATAEWLEENAPAGDDGELFKSLTLAPKRIIASRTVSSRLVIQGGSLFRAWLEASLIDLLAVEAERVAIAGTGANNQPCGILNAIDGTGSVVGGADGAAPTATHLADLEHAVTGTNDASRGPLGFLVSPKTRRKLRLTPYWAGSTACAPVWSQNEADRLLGHPAGVTTAMPDNLLKGVSTTCSPIIFGNFSEQITAFWGPGIGISIIDDRDLAVAGKVLVIAAAYVDCGVRDPRAFDAMKDALCD